jgi:hypothetical protein
VCWTLTRWKQLSLMNLVVLPPQPKKNMPRNAVRTAMMEVRCHHRPKQSEYALLINKHKAALCISRDIQIASNGTESAMGETAALKTYPRLEASRCVCKPKACKRLPKYRVRAGNGHGSWVSGFRCFYLTF